ncbi:MAG: S8 family serine peptidase [Caldilineaceae bacterium]|nr:S8 family serine peptidase [Caldilineaceae bacterium]
MAPFSSRGPTDDGRIKPDVVAPGTWILSTASDLYQEGYGDPVNPQTNTYQYDGWGMPYNQQYKYMGGTSMANPIAAGGAAVIRDFYQKAHSNQHTVTRGRHSRTADQHDCRSGRRTLVSRGRGRYDCGQRRPAG